MDHRSGESPQERLTRYLRLAREAKELAAKSKTVQMREACMAMAQSWLALASDLRPCGVESAAWAALDVTQPESGLSAEE